MPRRRRERFETEPDQKVLDRLAGLSHFIPDDLIQQATAHATRPDRRDTVLTNEIVLWVVLAMGLLTDLPLRQVFKHARRLRPGEHSPPRSSLCVARRRLGVAPLRHLFDRLVRPLAGPGTPGAFYKGLRLMGIDSTVLDLPDSADNARVFGKPKGGRAEAAFPQVRKLSLVELGTHAELAFVLKPCHRGETSMVEPLLRHLRPGMLLMCDRGFFGYRLWKSLQERKIGVLARVKNGLILKPVEVLGDGSYLARVYPSPKHRERDRGGIVVRVIKYELDDPQRVGHRQEHTLVTTLLDAEKYPAKELIVGYHERWEEELVFDEQKTHQDPRRAEKPTHLRSQTPAGVVQEVYALSLGHYVTRALMSEAAASVKVDPDRLSFVGCLRILRCRLPECPGGSEEGRRKWWEAVRWEMSQERLPPRRNRINPRVVKRKMSKFKKKRAAHRGLPQLRKSFAQAIILKQ
jgi:hypothetical protein